MNQLNYIKQLDGLRFYSILAVMLAHWIHSKYTYFGGLGVIVFFVLSGYLITRILLLIKERHPDKLSASLFKVFYIRRALRIFPIYFISIMLLYYAGLPDIKTYFGWLLSFTVNIKFFIDNNFYGSIGHLWSLSVEEQFYLFYPFLILWINNRYLFPLLLLMAVVGVLTRFILFMFDFGLISQATFTLCAFDSLAIGGILAYFELYRKQLLIKLVDDYKKVWLLVLALFMICYIFFIAKSILINEFFNAYILIFSRLFISLLAFYLIAAAILGRDNNYKSYFENKYIVYLGKISYGMYFYHLFVQRAIDYLIRQIYPVNNQYVMFSLYFLATVMFSMLSWKYLESPINNLKTKFNY